MTAAKQGNQSARRAIRLLSILQGHAVQGLRLKQIAEALRVPSCTALRDLETLADEGFAERMPEASEFWRLSPRPIQIARAHDADIRKWRERVDELDQRYSRLPT